MSKRRYKFNVVDIDVLAQAYPHAVVEKTIPATVERRPDYAYVARLLDCKLQVPGIKVIEEEQDGQERPQPAGDAGAPIPVKRDGFIARTADQSVADQNIDASRADLPAALRKVPA